MSRRNKATNLPEIINNTTSTGAAADSVDIDERLKGLPRLLRYAMLTMDGSQHIEDRLIAEIHELCPQLPDNANWASQRKLDAALALSAELDRRAVAKDEPSLRSLADCVRLLSLPPPHELTHFEEHRRVGKALIHAFQLSARHAEQDLRRDLELFAFGWAALPACTDILLKDASAAVNAIYLGRRMAEHRIAAAVRAAVRIQIENEEQRKQEEAEEKQKTAARHAPIDGSGANPNGQVVVVRLSEAEMKNSTLKGILAPLQNVINTPLPLVEAPPLHKVRQVLAAEFPYALSVIDFALADLVGRATVRLRPLLLLGDPGGGKSRFARRLGESLNVSVWREDASRADGAMFGGTARRWHSAEPCHAFLAIAQGKIANPLVLIDELEKAGTRSDYGRLWDCLLSFLEPETSCRYPDPALQTTLDVSQVSYVATANSLHPLPTPIRDRFRVIAFPKPAAEDLDALLPVVLAELAKERGLDQNWVPPLDGLERAAVGQHWHGGSVRLLRRIVEAVLRERDLRAPRN